MKCDFFKNWSVEMAYYLGWLWADGSIVGDSKICLGCITEDEHILLSFKDCICSSSVIHRTPSFVRENGINVSPFSSSVIYSRQMVDDLILIHGMLPNKTYLDLAPKDTIPNDLFNHFVRGYFDGDGSLVFTGQGYYRIDIVGSPRFLNILQEGICNCIPLPKKKLSKLINTNVVKSLHWSKMEEVLCFLKWIYPEQCKYPFLFRKKERFLSIETQLQDVAIRFGITVHPHRKKFRVRCGQKHFGEFFTLKEAIIVRNAVYKMHRSSIFEHLFSDGIYENNKN